jgi:hypothetical protein
MKRDWIAFAVAFGMIVVAGFIGGMIAAATLKLIF